MKKEEVVRGAVKLIEKFANDLGLEVEDKGEGHAFDGSFWDGILTDDSRIPNVRASKDGFSIELRSFWGNPEVDVRRAVVGGDELLVLNFSDSFKNANGEYVHTGEFFPHEVRVDAMWDYKACVKEVYDMIAFIENNGRE